MESDTPRTDDEFSDAIKQLDLRAELAEMSKKLAEARGLYLQRNYHREQLERELAAAKAELAAAKEAQRDADRYRWLKSGGCYWVEIQSQPSGDYIFRGQAARSIGGSIDNAIDAVLAAQQEGGGA